MNFFKAVIAVLAACFPSVHAAHVLLKDGVICPSKDENIKDIYDTILSFNPLSSTEEVNKILEEKYPQYSVRFMPDSLYGLHNVVMYCKKQRGQVNWSQEQWKQFNLKHYFYGFCSPFLQTDVNRLISGYYVGPSLRSKVKSPMGMFNVPNKLSEISDFWPKINQSFVYEFGLIQDYFCDKDQGDPFDQKPEVVWQEYINNKDVWREYIQDKHSIFMSEHEPPVLISPLVECIFERVCELEAKSEDHLILVRGTDGFMECSGREELSLESKIHIDSTFWKGQKVKSLSFGSGLFQAINTTDKLGGPLGYLHLNYFYAVPIDKKNTSIIFLPKVNPLVSINSDGEWHPRSFLYGTHGDEIDDCMQYKAFHMPCAGVKWHPDFCYDPAKSTPLSLTLEKFCKHVDWAILIRATPLRGEDLFFETAYSQLKSLYEEDLDSQEGRKKDFIKFLDNVQRYLSQKALELCSKDSENGDEIVRGRQSLQSDVTKYLDMLNKVNPEKNQEERESKEEKNSLMEKLESLESEKFFEDDFGHKKLKKDPENKK
jgi:hypothetical protein